MLSSTRNLLIMNMAVAGILLCTLTMPLTLLDQLHTNWVFGESRVIKIWFLTKNYLKLIANNASIFPCTKYKLVNTNRNNVVLLRTHYRPKELSLYHKLLIYNPYFFETQCRKSLIFQTYII